MLRKNLDTLLNVLFGYHKFIMIIMTAIIHRLLSLRNVTLSHSNYL